MGKNKVLKINQLTPVQDGMLFYAIANPDSLNYYDQYGFFIEGNVNINCLKVAWQEIINRHEIFRTDFRWNGLKTPAQIVLAEKEAEIYEFDISNISHIAQKEYLKEYKAKDLAKRFSFEEGRLNRLSIIMLSSEKYYVCWTYHHILLDGWSTSIVIGQFFQIYNCLVNNLPLPSKPVADFGDYLNWLKKQHKQKGTQFWQEYLKDFIEPTFLPIDYRVKKDEIISEAIIEQISFDPAKTLEIQRFCRHQNITINTFFQTAWGILLQKYNNTNQSCIGMPVLGRPHQLEHVEEIVGLFINTLPVIIKTEAEVTIGQLLNQVNTELVKIREFEYMPLVDIQKLSHATGALFDTIVVLESGALSDKLKEMDMGFDLHLDSVGVLTNYDLTVEITSGKILNMRLNFNAALFKSATIQRIRNHLLKVVQTMLIQPDMLVHNICLLTDKELQQIVKGFNQTEAAYPTNQTIQQLFETQVEKAPDEIAVLFLDQQLTYHELNARANQLARILRAKGVRRDTIVGISLYRSFEMIIGIIGILKAGGAYLPIDPNYPKERIDYILEDSKIEILLTQGGVVEQLQFNGSLINLEDEGLYIGETANLLLINHPNDLAYIIYTSGSTGKPKGVMIEHTSTINRLNWMQKKYPIDENDVILQKTPFTFDVSVWELFWWSFTGAKVCLLTPGGEKDPATIVEAIQKYRVTTMHFVPSMLNTFLEYLENVPSVEKLTSLRQVFASGEALQMGQVVKFNAYLHDTNTTTLHNLYGPTEATVDVTYFDCSTDKELAIIPIGKPIDNIRLYVVDKNLNLQPIGVPGELCIAGVGLARGYLNKLEMTEEKFLPNPWNPGERLYKTGDLVAWLSDGNIEYKGRTDFQVKIRGFRIELGEIEAQLLQYPTIKSAVVLAREDASEDKYLCAYIVSDEEISSNELRKYLGKNLPEHMIPYYFVRLEQLPLSTNGKVNQKALPEPERMGLREYVAPETRIERKIAEIWSDILGIERIGRNDNFFELGGHSLKAIKAMYSIQKECGVELSLRDLFHTPILEELANLLEGRGSYQYERIHPLPDQPYYELSYGQNRIFIMNQKDPESTAYNMPGRLTLTEAVNVADIQHVIETLIARHEGFRTTFHLIEGQPVQVIHPTLNVTVEVTDISHLPDEERKTGRITLYQKEAMVHFNLADGPLFTVRVIKVQEDEADLIFVMHHIICDGFSVEILKREFFELYQKVKIGQKLELPPLPVQYKDFAVWQNRLLTSPRMEEAKNFFARQLQGDLPILDLPTDYPASTLKKRDSAAYHAVVPGEVQDGLKHLAHAHHASLFMVLLAGWILLLYHITGNKDILIGMPVAGREHEDVKNVLGFFVNTVILRNQIDPKVTFGELLDMIQENTLQSLEYQSYPLEIILGELKLSFPNIPVFFNMLNLVDAPLQELQDVRPYHVERVQDVKFDIVLYLVEYTNGIEINCNYVTGVFEPATIEFIINDYIELLSRLILNPMIRVDELN